MSSPHPTDAAMSTPEPTDPVLAALDELLVVLRENMERNEGAVRRAQIIRELRERGHEYREIVPMEERPLIVELLTSILSDLSDASGRFRRAEARALYSEGLTMSEIAELFGITRQRVAALIRKSSAIVSSFCLSDLYLGGILDPGYLA
ncbi:MAG: hypothetical protein ACRDJI_03840 [Actinomycetota bacterium]